MEITEIKRFIDEARCSTKYQQAEKGLRYYEAKHDIEDYKIYYFNDDGQMVEDKHRSNIKISHPFFTELVDQAAQYMLSGKDRYVKCDDQKLQAMLDEYFDDEFKQELSDLLTYTQVEGDSFLYRYVDEDFRTRFKFADGMNVVEVPAKYSADKRDYVIYWYFDKKEKDRTIERVQVWSDKDVAYYVMIDGDTLEEDKDVTMNPRPHVLYEEGDERLYDTFGDVPFLRLDNNKKRLSGLHVIKNLIDDYDLMSCGLSNNLQDVAEGIYVVKGWQGESLDELTKNVKVKKQVAVGEGGDLDIKTINVPYQARQAKMALNEVNIYRFGMGFNTAAMGDGNVTNVVIRSRYALLDMKCNKLESNLKKVMKKVIKIVVEEINRDNGTAYNYKDVWCDFEREIITNALDNMQIEQLEAQTQQVKVATLLQLAAKIGDDAFLEKVCEVMDYDYEDIKAKIKQNAPIDLNAMSDNLMNTPTEPDAMDEVVNEEVA